MQIHNCYLLLFITNHKVTLRTLTYTYYALVMCTFLEGTVVLVSDFHSCFSLKQSNNVQIRKRMSVVFMLFCLAVMSLLVFQLYLFFLPTNYNFLSFGTQMSVDIHLCFSVLLLCCHSYSLSQEIYCVYLHLIAQQKTDRGRTC